MTIEQKREALEAYCGRHNCDDDCLLGGEGLCENHTIAEAPEDEINNYYEMVFGSEHTRATILDAAKAIVCDGRPQEYGGPEDSFGRIAALWSAYTGHDYTAHDVAMMMALLKVARIQGGKYNKDNYVDLAGYAACAGEIGGKG